MAASPLFTGCAAALVTPFLPDGSLDEPALRLLIAMQRENRMDALVLLGTTAMVIFRLPMFDAFGLTITSLSNIGPALGHNVGATGSWDILPDGAIWLQSFLMLAGRLEIYSLFLPFIPEFWSNR